MDFPFKIQFRNMEESDFIYNSVWEHAEKLGRFYNRIISCDVVIAAPHHHSKSGKLFHVQIRLHAPAGDVFVSTGPQVNPAHEDVYVAIRDAFDAARRKLEDIVRIRRDGKERGPTRGRVMRVFRGEGYGFITTPDRREIYFHENSVLHHDFEKLEVGDEVRFSEEMGEKGPQVTSMARVAAASLNGA